MTLTKATQQAPWWRRLVARFRRRALTITCARCGKTALDSPSPKVEFVRCSGQYDIGWPGPPRLICMSLMRSSS